LATIRLRVSINSYLDDQGVTRPAEIGKAVGLPATEAVRLLNRRQYRDGDLEALQRAAEHLGLMQTASGHWMASADRAADGAPLGGD
jgi:hypothetical protein